MLVVLRPEPVQGRLGRSSPEGDDGPLIPKWQAGVRTFHQVDCRRQRAPTCDQGEVGEDGCGAREPVSVAGFSGFAGDAR